MGFPPTQVPPHTHTCWMLGPLDLIHLRMEVPSVFKTCYLSPYALPIRSPQLQPPAQPSLSEVTGARHTLSFPSEVGSHYFVTGSFVTQSACRFTMQPRMLLILLSSRVLGLQACTIFCTCLLERSQFFPSFSPPCWVFVTTCPPLV